jgi:hypothetical protein
MSPSTRRSLLNAYTVASGLLLIFATAHTVGGLLVSRSFGPEGDAVLASMKAVHFDFIGSERTFYDFHLGFGLTTSIFLVFSAALSWHLGRAAPLPVLRPVAWALFLANVGNMALSWAYFFVSPGIFSTAIALLLGWECMTSFNDPKIST